MRADPKDSKVTQTMVGLGVPEPVARAKTRAWKGGNYVAALGGVIALASFAFPFLSFIVLKESPGLLVVVLALSGLSVGGLLVYIGGHAASGEAMDAAGESGSKLAGAIAAAARKVRGGT
jgi:hypothetical protein